MSDEPKAGPDDHLQLRPRANDPLGLGADRELGVGNLRRREPRRARERQRALASWLPKLIEAKPSNNSD